MCSTVDNLNSKPIQSSTRSVGGSLMRACFIWGLAALFFFYDYLLQNSPGAMKPELMQAFVKEAEQFGSLSAYFLLAYGLMQIPAGLLLDRFGPRKIITVACVLCACGSLVFGYADTLLAAKFGRVLIGLGASFALISCLKIASVWFPMNRYALLTGLTVTVGFSGAAFGTAFVSRFIEFFGSWRETMHWGAGLGFVLAACLWLVVRDKKEHAVQEQGEIQNAEPQVQYSVIQSLRHVLRDKQTWVAALFAGLMFVPTLAIGGLWGTSFLVEAHGFDRDTAGWCTALIYVGWIVGGTFWGFCSDFLRRRNLPMMVANICSLIIIVCVIYIEHMPLWLFGTLFFGLGLFSSGFILAFAVVGEINPPHLRATATGFTNAMNTLWGALAQPFIGLILDMNKQQPAVSGEQVFSLAEYQSAFVALPICLGVSFLILLLLRETNCKVIGQE